MADCARDRARGSPRLGRRPRAAGERGPSGVQRRRGSQVTGRPPCAERGHPPAATERRGRNARPAGPRSGHDLRRVPEGATRGSRLRSSPRAHASRARRRRLVPAQEGRPPVLVKRLAAWGVALAAVIGSVAAKAEPRPAVERTVARFSAAEIGGAAHPRFVEERLLAFETRLEVMAEKAEGTGEAYQERHVRDALEHHVGEELLASLANKLIVESPPSRRPTEEELDRIEQDLGAAELERLGGRARVEAAAAAEQLDPSVVDALLRRQA